MAIPIELFELGGKVSITVGESGKILLNIEKNAKSADIQLERLEKQALSTSAAFKRLGDSQKTAGGSALSRDFANLKNSLNNLAPAETERRVLALTQKLNALNQELFEAKRISLQSATGSKSFFQLLGLESALSSAGLLTAALAAATAEARLFQEALSRASSFQGLTRGLQVITGNAELAKAKIQELEQVAKETPGLTFRQAIEAQRNLQAAGQSAGDATREIKAFANALAVVGGSSTQFDGILLALTQIANKSKISAEEINQLAERLPQIRTVITNAFGTSDTEVLQKQGISPTEFLAKVTAELEKMPKAAQGTSAAWENLSDATDKAFVKFGSPALPALNKLLNTSASFLDRNSEAFEKWGGRAAGALEKAGNLLDVIDRSGAVVVLEGVVDGLYRISEWIPSNALIWMAGQFVESLQRANRETDILNSRLNALSEQDRYKPGGTAGFTPFIPKTSTAAGQTLKIDASGAKETYDNRLKELENFKQAELNVINRGNARNKTEEIARLKEQLRVEKEYYQKLIQAREDYYFTKALAEKNPQKRAVITTEGRIDLSKAALDFQSQADKIKDQIRQNQIEIENQTRTATIEAIRIAREEAERVFNNAFDALNEQFGKGFISPESFTQSARQLVKDYFAALGKSYQDEASKQFNNEQLTFDERKNIADAFLTDRAKVADKEKALLKQITDSTQNFTRDNSKALNEYNESVLSATDTAIIAYGQLLRAQNQAGRNAEGDFVLFSTGLQGVSDLAKNLYGDLAKQEENLFRAVQIAEEAKLERRRDSLRQQLALTVDNANEQAKISREIAQVEYDLDLTRIKNETAYYEFLFRKLEERQQKEKETADYILKINADSQDALFEARRKALERATTNGSFRQFDRQRGEFDDYETVIPRTSALDRLNTLERSRAQVRFEMERDRLEQERDAQLKSIQGLENEAQLKASIEAAYQRSELDNKEAFEQAKYDLELEYQEKRRALLEQENFDALNPFAKGLFGELGVENFLSEAEATTKTLEQIGKIGAQAFGDFAGAVGSLVQNWVLYGNVGPGAARKAVAASLAAAAQQSTVSAIMETAYGIAALTPWGAAIYGNPGFHFKSAALFGIVAAGTALAGRAVAGNSFNNGSAQAGGTVSGSAQTNANGQPQSQVITRTVQPVQPNNIDSNNIFRSSENQETSQLIGALIQQNKVLSDQLQDVKVSYQELKQSMDRVTTTSPGEIWTNGFNERSFEAVKQIGKQIRSDNESKRDIHGV